MRILLGGEFSGRVRDAFALRGHDAVSCDYRPTERPGNHLLCSYFDMEVVNGGWDMAIFFPDCTFLTVSGARWNVDCEWRQEAQLSALHHVKALWKFPVAKLAIENPIGRLSSLWRGPTQTIQPWMFGDNETKATCLWLRGLSPLLPQITTPPEIIKASVWREPPGPDRKKNRSRTQPGIANAFAEQWGGVSQSIAA